MRPPRRYQHPAAFSSPPSADRGGFTWERTLLITIPLLLALVFRDQTAALIRSVVPSLSGHGPASGPGGGRVQLHAAHAALAEVRAGDAGEESEGGNSQLRPRLKRTRRQRGGGSASATPFPIEEDDEGGDDSGGSPEDGEGAGSGYGPGGEKLLGAEAHEGREGTGAASEHKEEEEPVPVPPGQVELHPDDPPPPPPAAPAPAPGTSTASTSTATAAQDDVSPAVLTVPDGSPPLNAILIVAPGTRVFPELARTLASIAEYAPDALVVLLVTPTEADQLKDLLVAPPLPGSGEFNAQVPGKLRLFVRMYSWAFLDGRLPESHRARFPSIKRYEVYPDVLADLEGRGVPLGGTFPDSILFSNVPPAMLRAPDAVFLSDGRDVVFQRDPFPEFWTRAGAAAARRAVAEGRSVENVPGGGTGWATGLAAFKFLLTAQEAQVMRLEEEDWNRSWVHYCYYYLGETMVNNKWILCSGTTLGTREGIAAYLARGMAPASDMCDQIGWEKGMDQGMHNVLLAAYTPDDWARVAAWEEEPRMKGKKDALVGAVQALQAELSIDYARAEDGYICTVALLQRLDMSRDSSGYVTKTGDTSSRCAVVHQVDRDTALNDWSVERFRVSR